MIQTAHASLAAAGFGVAINALHSMRHLCRFRQMWLNDRAYTQSNMQIFPFKLYLVFGVPNVKYTHLTAVLSLVLTSTLAIPAVAQSISYGDDSSEWANDDECDDRRFYGVGMASDLSRDDDNGDATDCKHLLEMGEIKVWNLADAKANTQCSAINFGDNSSEWATDGECDDPRFEGKGTSDTVITDDIGHDAKDCRAACDAGNVFLRNY
jgi:hypothetical protein